jgi:hypothetical protein
MTILKRLEDHYEKNEWYEFITKVLPYFEKSKNNSHN